MTEVNIGLNDEMTEILEVESNLGGGMNFRYCYEKDLVPNEFEFSVMGIENLQHIIDAIQEHIDNNS